LNIFGLLLHHIKIKAPQTFHFITCSAILHACTVVSEANITQIGYTAKHDITHYFSFVMSQFDAIHFSGYLALSTAKYVRLVKARASPMQDLSAGPLWAVVLWCHHVQWTVLWRFWENSLYLKKRRQIIGLDLYVDNITNYHFYLGGMGIAHVSRNYIHVYD